MADRMGEGDERIAKARAGSIVRHGARARLIASVAIGITRRSHGARSVPFVSRAIGLILPVTRHVCTDEAIRRVDRAAEHQVRLVPSWTLLRPRGALDSVPSAPRTDEGDGCCSDQRRPEHPVEAARELGVMIPNQNTHRFAALTERPRDLARPLCHPLTIWTGRAAGEVQAPTGEVNEEQHVQPLEPDHVDREEVDRHDAPRLRSEELALRGPERLAPGPRCPLRKTFRTVVADT